MMGPTFCMGNLFFSPLFAAFSRIVRLSLLAKRVSLHFLQGGTNRAGVKHLAESERKQMPFVRSQRADSPELPVEALFSP